MKYQNKKFRLGLSLLMLFMVSLLTSTGSLVGLAEKNQSVPNQLKPVSHKEQSERTVFLDEESIVKAVQADHDQLRQQAHQSFQDQVKRQLLAKGLPVPKTKAALSDSPVTLVVEFDQAPAVMQTEQKNGRQTRLTSQDLDQAKDASKKILAEQEPSRQAVEKIAKKKADHQFSYLTNGLSIVTKAQDVAAIESVPGVKRVTVANVYQPQDLAANQLVQATKLWQRHQLKGDRTVIAIIDTGIDTSHELMQIDPTAIRKISRTAAQAAIKALGHGTYSSEKVPFSYNYADGTANTTFDLPGNSMHGMHVAGLAAGYARFPDFIHFQQKSAAIGAAPNAQLLNLKVFSNNGGGATSDDVIAAIEDAVKLKADVINLSLGNVSGQNDPDSPEQAAVTLAAQQGVLPVIAAGNAGLSTSKRGLNSVNTRRTNDSGTVGAPGVTPAALTVASSDNLVADVLTDASAKLSRLSSFSSYGPTPDLQLKPDITAPGGRLLSSLNNNQYGLKSGTSMATPVMAGSVALLVQSLAGKVPPDQISQYLKTAVMNTALPLVDERQGALISPRVQGAGLAQVESALANQVFLTTTAGQPSLSLGAFMNNRQSFQVCLDNHSAEDQSYLDQSDLRVWTDGSIPGHLAIDQQVKGGQLTCLGQSESKPASATVDDHGRFIIKVPAHSRVTVQYHLTLPDRPIEGFIEGFLQLDPLAANGHIQKKGAVRLSLPYLGYYGDWQGQAIFDQPAWEQDSYYGQTALVDQKRIPVGLTAAGRINPANAAISPKNSAASYRVEPQVNLWRNAQEIMGRIYQNDPRNSHWTSQDPIRVVNFDHQIIKSYYQYQSGTFTAYRGGGYGWQGDCWNQKTGKLETVPDGQYYYQLTGHPVGTSEQPGSPQDLVLPVKIDQTKPTMTNVKIQGHNDWVKGDKDSSLKVTGHLHDQGSGIDTFGRIALVVNGYLQLIDQPLSQDHQEDQDLVLSLNGVQQQSLLEHSQSEISLLAFDNAGNLMHERFTVKNLVDGSLEKVESRTDQPEKVAVADDNQAPTKAKKPNPPNNSGERVTAPVESGPDQNSKRTAQKGQVSSDLPVILFDHHLNLKLNVVTSQTSYYNEKKEELKISGYLLEGQAELYVGETAGHRHRVAVDPATGFFETIITAKANAKTAVPVQVKLNGETLFDGGLRFYIDTTLPDLTLFDESSLTLLADGSYQIKTKQRNYQLAGQVSDNFDGYHLTVNGNMLVSQAFSLAFNHGHKGQTSKFSLPLHLTPGDNFARLVVTDAVGNVKQKKINIRYYRATPPSPQVQKSTSQKTTYPVILTAQGQCPPGSPSDNHCTVFYSLDCGQKWLAYHQDLAIAHNQTVLFKTIDAYGNESALTTVTVNNIQGHGSNLGSGSDKIDHHRSKLHRSKPTGPGFGQGRTKADHHHQQKMRQRCRLQKGHKKNPLQLKPILLGEIRHCRPKSN